ncbi:flavin-binding monooxygenase-like protein-like protein [Lindgomyces ingoldianus]|uniref:Flavin-binding monooxygenase-like protein-like protein n=1 Tax=Lindgomyces ingoldianus TaxID=673940 RepID=A0ACB6QHF0_9PLEO|nr:flavin-binding monooxygenase-like protein-like protein [Lindgomyces ingoldianus]KAF2466351.1 flavin-binding monooxygenase-like protein-like protein [Lindgomyces ingoldianus]
MDNLDMIIIGAGVYGIQAARTYLEFHPSHNIAILEADSCPGGVWSANRMYDAFWTQSPLEMWEYSDQPLKDVELKDTHHMYFQARHFTVYLDGYLKSHVYGGKTLTDRIVLNTKVERLWKENGVWHAQTSSGKSYIAPKVIDASGLTSIPNIPQIPGANTFKGKMIHHKDFGRSDIWTCKTCVVVGGAKSAADVAYAYAKAGLEVHWVIRKSGNGPAAYFPADSPVSYYQNSNEAFHHRMMASMSASIFTPESWWTRFLQQTAIGRACVKFVWGYLQRELYSRAKYDRKDGQENGFMNLKPDTGLFWQNDSSGVNQRADFFDTIAKKVKVYRQDIECIDIHNVHLANGTTIDADAIVFATGWKDSPLYIDPHTAYYLGLATPKSAEDLKEASKWATLETSADAEILKRYPILSNPPPCHKRSFTETPFRLYKSILPIHDRSIVFLGRMVLANHTYNAEVQSLFAIAALDNTLNLPSEADMEEEVASVRAWQKRRYPARGEAGNWFWYDIVPYTDAVLKQLGLESHRMKGVSDFFRPAVAKNLEGLVEEYRKKTGGSEDRKTR